MIDNRNRSGVRHPIVLFVSDRAADLEETATTQDELDEAERLDDIALLDHDGLLDRPDAPYYCGECGTGYPCRAIRVEAARFAEHPDYREEWRP